MKFIFILLCITFCQCAKLQPDFRHDWLSDEYIEFVQSQAHTWKAGRNFHRDRSLKSLARQMGSIRISHFVSRDVADSPEDLPVGFTLPQTFDAREKWSFCPTIKEIRDQGNCGSCWAISSVEVMSDRTCVLSEGKQNFHYSTEDLMSCCHSCGMGCNGGDPMSAFLYWKNNGIVSGGIYNSSEGCMPYEIPPCEHHVDGDRPKCGDDSTPTPRCEQKCQSSYATSYQNDLHKAEKVYSIDTEQSAMSEIVANGPISASLDVYSDFLSYKSGVYQTTPDAYYVGGHAIRVIGFGTENGVPYWLCANSWNSDWGDQGLFKIRRGVNECGIEEDFVAGIPLFKDL